MNKPKIVEKYARLWPREVFDIQEQGRKHRLAARLLEELRNPGVYILYRDEVPYYIGKTNKRPLFKRLHDHANKSTDRYFNFWNYFSVFVVRNPAAVDEVEGILIASMPTANSAAPKIEEMRLPREIAKVLRDARKRALRPEG